MIFVKILAVALIIAVLWVLAIKPSGRKKTGETARRIRGFRFAHRGLYENGGPAPENSLAAFEKAVARGYGSELDVHLTRDEKLVVIHDSRLERMCGKDGNVEDLTAEQAVLLKLLGSEEKIPRFEKVLDVVGGKTPLVIEIKTYGDNAARLTELVCKALNGYNGDFCIESFDPRVLLWLRKNRPTIIRGQLAGFIKKSGGKIKWIMDFCCRNLVCNFITKPDFIAYQYSDRHHISMAACRRIWGAWEFSWTIRTPQQLKDCENGGATPIFEHFEP